MKKFVIGCSIGLVLLLGFVVLTFYIVFTPKSRDVSNEAPFKEIIGKTLVAKTRTLILIYPNTTMKENYRYHLEDGTGFGMESELETIAEIPKGSSFTIDKVELHTGSVSGTTTAYLFGKVYGQKSRKEYKFQYSWGHYHSLYQDNPYWSFDKSFWQNEALEEKYFIEVP